MHVRSTSSYVHVPLFLALAHLACANPANPGDEPPTSDGSADPTETRLPIAVGSSLDALEPYGGRVLEPGRYWLSVLPLDESVRSGIDSVTFLVDGKRIPEADVPLTVGPVQWSGGRRIVTWSAHGNARMTGQVVIRIADEQDGDGPTGSADRIRPGNVDASKLDRLYGTPALKDEWRALGDPKYDSLVFHWGAYHEERQSARDPGREWEATYYDRGFGWCAAHRRYGGDVWRDRCHRTIRFYRDDYVLKKKGRTSPKWMFPEGLGVHYLETGEEASLDALRMMALEHRNWIDGKDDILTTRYRDGRIQGRSILNFIVLHELEPDPEYAEAVRAGIDRLVAWYDAAGATGAWDSAALPWSGAPDREKLSYCGGMATFQVAHAILYVFFRAHELGIYTHPRLREIVTRTLDTMWRHWIPGEGFAYIIPPRDHPEGQPFQCGGSGTDAPAPDVSLLIATSFGYGYALTGDTRFRDRGDRIWRFGVGGTVKFPRIYWKGSKQHNQSIYRAWRYPWLTR